MLFVVGVEVKVVVVVVTSLLMEGISGKVAA